MWPRPCRIIWSYTAAIPYTTPLRLMSMARSHASQASAWSAKNASGMTPALLTSTSSEPKRSTANAASRSTCSFSVTSTANDAPVQPSDVSCSTVAAAAASSMSAATTLAPSRAVIAAIDLPKPLPAPVITITRSRTWLGAPTGCSLIAAHCHAATDGTGRVTD